MASNLGCVGLAVADEDELAVLLQRTLPHSKPIGEFGGVAVYRWQDPSGSRLVVSTRGSEVLDVLPTCATAPGAHLSSIGFLSDDVAMGSVIDEHGDEATRMAFALEAGRLLRGSVATFDGRAALTGLGVEIEVFPSEASFAASDASLLTPRDSSDATPKPPPLFVEKGWNWPPRMSSESFISLGLFGEPQHASAHAQLAGTVLQASRHTVELTGQGFIQARVRTAGFEASVCYPAEGNEVPRAGNVVFGTVFLVASLEISTSPARRRLFRRS